VIAVARTVGALEELDDEIKSGGGSATLVPLDLKDFEAIDRMGTPWPSAGASSTSCLPMPGCLAPSPRWSTSSRKHLKT
jgi:hypothetical protein